MAQGDFTDFTNSSSLASLDRGVTAGQTPPAGGANHVFGWNSLDNNVNVHGVHNNQAGFSPLSKGARIECAMKRGLSGGTTQFAPFVFYSASNDTASSAYILGLADSEPANIVLRKGVVSSGLPNNAAGSPSTLGTLLRSVETVANDVWIHLRLDVITQGTGDVVLRCYKNTDLDTGGGVGSPVWALISGMEIFTDDALGAITGSLPHTAGYTGFGFQSTDTARRGYVDHFSVARQLL